MKKTAIALVMLICLLTGALLPALAEMDAPRPAVTDAPGVEEKPTEEAELPEKDEVPAEPKATEAPRGGDGRRNFAVPKAGEKPDAPAEEPGTFESLEPPQPHGHPGAAHGKRHHGEDGPNAGPDAGRRPGAGRGPHHEAPHCRRCEPEDGGRIALAVRMRTNAPDGRTGTPPNRCRTCCRNVSPAGKRRKRK